MKYVYYGQTYAADKTFCDHIMTQNEFTNKFPNIIDDQFVDGTEVYKIYMMNLDLQETAQFIIDYRDNFIKRGFKAI